VQLQGIDTNYKLVSETVWNSRPAVAACARCPGRIDFDQAGSCGMGNGSGRV